MLNTSPHALVLKVLVYIYGKMYVYVIKIFQWLQVSKKKIQKIDSYLTLYQNQESIVNKSHLALLRNITLWLFNS